MRQDPASMLLELATDPLDPGYAAAAARRGPDHRQGWTERAATALGCLVIGFVLVIAYHHTNRSAPTAAKVHEGLVVRVRSAEAASDVLQRTAEQLAGEVAALRDAGLGSSALRDALVRAEATAGARAVNGPGLRVQLGDAPAPTASPPTGRGGTFPIPATASITDRDVRSVVNELWADGAEAIAVNGIRLTATSAIRFAGEAVLVDFRPITSPYVIEAIGDENALITRFADSPIASRYQTQSGVRGIVFRLTQEGELHLTATAAVVPRYARTGP